MSEFGERLTRIETLVEGILYHNRIRDKWMMGILSALVVGIMLFALPGCATWISEIGVEDQKPFTGDINGHFERDS